MDYDKDINPKKGWKNTPLWVWIFLIASIAISLLVGGTVKSYLFPKGDSIGYAKKVTLIGELEVAIGDEVITVPIKQTYCGSNKPSERNISKEALVKQALARTKYKTPTFTPISIEVSACNLNDSFGAYIIKKKDREL